MRNLLVVALLAALLTTSGCTRTAAPTPPPPAATTSTPVVEGTPAAEPPAAEQTEETADPPIEPLPDPVPVSTGPLNLSGGQTDARAKLIIVGSHSIRAIAVGGGDIGTWTLPGDLRTLIEGLSYSFGRAPTIVSHAPYSWVYDWGGFSVTDFSPSISSPADPPYKISVTVRAIGVTEFQSVEGIHVGDPASRATAEADEVIDSGGMYWATVDSFHVAVPGLVDPRIYLEISAPSGTGAITEIRGPTGSWTS